MSLAALHKPPSSRAYWVIAVTFVAWTFALNVPRYVEVCTPPNQQGDAYCGDYQVVVAPLVWVMDSMDAHQGFVIGLLTIALAWIAILQRRTMAEQHESAKRIERAYVFLSTTPTRNANFKLPLATDSLRPLQFANFGATPAKVELITASCKHWPDGVLETLQEQPSDGQKIETHAVWLAGGREPLAVNYVKLTASSEEIKKANTGDGVIALLGTLKYRDMFDDPREVGFAYYMRGTAFQPDGGGGGTGGTVAMDEIPNRHLNYSN